MTALTIIQDACGRLGIQVPTAVFSSTDEQVIQMRSLLNEAGKALARIHDWKVLNKEQTFTTVAASAQTNAVPLDFDRYLNETMFNRSQHEKIYGPFDSSEWQLDKAGFTGLSVTSAFRFRGDDILITPTPSAGDNVYYEYISKNWAESVLAVEKAKLTADDDVPLLDEELLTKALEWRFLRSKGLDYAEEFQDYEIQLANKIARDGGAKILNGSTEYSDDIFVNVPEGNWTL